VTTRRTLPLDRCEDGGERVLLACRILRTPGAPGALAVHSPSSSAAASLHPNAIPPTPQRDSTEATSRLHLAPTQLRPDAIAIAPGPNAIAPRRRPVCTSPRRNCTQAPSRLRAAPTRFRRGAIAIARSPIGDCMQATSRLHPEAIAVAPRPNAIPPGTIEIARSPIGDCAQAASRLHPEAIAVARCPIGDCTQASPGCTLPHSRLQAGDVPFASRGHRGCASPPTRLGPDRLRFAPRPLRPRGVEMRRVMSLEPGGKDRPWVARDPERTARTPGSERGGEAEDDAGQGGHVDGLRGSRRPSTRCTSTAAFRTEPGQRVDRVQDAQTSASTLLAGSSGPLASLAPWRFHPLHRLPRRLCARAKGKEPAVGRTRSGENCQDATDPTVRENSGPKGHSPRNAAHQHEHVAPRRVLSKWPGRMT
jgi:hypothetical protein